jgi:hypothetical protein
MIARNELIKEFADLNSLTYKKSKQERGRRFEKLISNLLEIEKMEPRINFRPKGEEIDISFVFADRVFLLEAKWRSGTIPASMIYSFKGKVDGKLLGTLGVFISMSAYSGEAVDALTYGKSVNIILFGKADFEYALSTPHGFQKVLFHKLRFAAEYGTPYADFSTLQVKAETNIASTGTTTTAMPTIEISQQFIGPAAGLVFKYDIFFVVEGVTDQIIVAAFVNRILEKYRIRKTVEIITSGGKYSTAQVANSFTKDPTIATKLVIVVDGDSSKEETTELIFENITNKQAVIITPTPTIDSWLKTSHSYSSPDAARTQSNIIFKSVIQDLVNKVDIENLNSFDMEFQKLVQVLTET